jgi:hypothetical protein
MCCIFSCCPTASNMPSKGAAKMEREQHCGSTNQAKMSSKMFSLRFATAAQKSVRKVLSSKPLVLCLLVAVAYSIFATPLQAQEKTDSLPTKTDGELPVPENSAGLQVVGDAQPFDFAMLKIRAKNLADQEYQAPPATLPEPIQNPVPGFAYPLAGCKHQVPHSLFPLGPLQQSAG